MANTRLTRYIYLVPVATIQLALQNSSLQENGERWKNKAGDAWNKPIVQLLLLDHLSTFIQHYQVPSSSCHPADHTADFLPQKCVTETSFKKGRDTGTC